MPAEKSSAKTSDSRGRRTRVDSPAFDPSSVWKALSQTPGVGVSITDSEGMLLFVNETAAVLFSEDSMVDYQGKHIGDFHPAEFTAERLQMIQRVLSEGKPLSICHIYHGRPIESTVWPIRDHVPPNNRVIVISHLKASGQEPDVSRAPETISTKYIDLGPLNVLTRRELEVLVLLGHGMSVPRVAELLKRSPKTIQRHKAAISQKLKVKGQAEMVAIVTSVGLDVSDAHLKRLPS